MNSKETYLSFSEFNHVAPERILVFGFDCNSDIRDLEVPKEKLIQLNDSSLSLMSNRLLVRSCFSLFAFLFFSYFSLFSNFNLEITTIKEVEFGFARSYYYLASLDMIFDRESSQRDGLDQKLSHFLIVVSTKPMFRMKFLL